VLGLGSVLRVRDRDRVVIIPIVLTGRHVPIWNKAKT